MQRREVSEGHGDFDELGLWFLRVEATGGCVSEAVMEAMNGTLHLGIWNNTQLVNIFNHHRGILCCVKCLSLQNSAYFESSPTL